MKRGVLLDDVSDVNTKETWDFRSKAKTQTGLQEQALPDPTAFPHPYSDLAVKSVLA